jgi:hypothetical protein
MDARTRVKLLAAIGNPNQSVNRTAVISIIHSNEENKKDFNHQKYKRKKIQKLLIN